MAYFCILAAKRGRYTHERRALIVEDAKRVEESRTSSFLPADAENTPDLLRELDEKSHQYRRKTHRTHA